MEAEVYAQVKTSIKRAMDIDLENYKEEQMKRRLDSWLIRSRMPTWKDYLSLISTDAEELAKFRNYLTINVTEFFRDPNRWAQVSSEILPGLIRNIPDQHATGDLKIWSAGCSTGAEAYTLAMIMEDSFPSRKYSILATDLDRGVLLKARDRGPYTQDDIRNLTPIQRQQYITPSEPYYVADKLRKRIQFQEQDLLKDRFDSGFDLIVCRNVVIYFTTASKDMLYEKFSRALRPSGVLFVGGTEIISTPQKFGLQSFGISFYRKV
jgi:chemotaxis protein methyltransferase CheR